MKVLYAITVMMLIFIGAGIYELYRAKQAESWPAHQARITESEIIRVSDGKYLRVAGVFLEDGAPFTVRRYAYGVVNSASLDRHYHALYPVGLVTDVYCNPNDRSEVILDIHPSLSGMYTLLGTQALLFLVGALFYVFRRRLPRVSMPRKEIQLTGVAGNLIGALVIAVFMGLGLWIIHMGRIGHTPAQALSPNETPGFIALGVLFFWGGLQTLIMAVGGKRLPRWAHAVLVSIFLACFAAPFILLGLLDPGGIHSSTSISGVEVQSSTGGPSGGIAFVGAGVLLLALIPVVFKKMIKKSLF